MVVSGERDDDAARSDQRQELDLLVVMGVDPSLQQAAHLLYFLTAPCLWAKHILLGVLVHN